MGKPAAKEGDQVAGVDTHIVMVPSPTGPIPTPLPSPFRGPLSASLSSTVFVDDHAAAVEGSEADNMPPHIPAGGTFQNPPANKATIQRGSATVFVDDKPMARNGDPAMTCNDPADAPKGRVIAVSTVIAD
jgi:uncharacterized Zn-binding protein involved in type VI secretion